MAKNVPRSIRKKELYKLILARSDIHASANAARLMLERVTGFGDPLYYPIFAATVICYARPFTNNKPLGALPNRYTRFGSKGHKKVHDDLMSARHELIAHSDMSIRQARIVPIGAVVAESNGKPLRSQSIGTMSNSIFFSLEYIAEIEAAARALGKRLNDDIDELVQELYGDRELPEEHFPLVINEDL